ncbi:MAG: hypothetical protein Q9M16_06090 [Mariprofundus sp.]|nr:hypothetical protein [Mariprofundus sp.]
MFLFHSKFVVVIVVIFGLSGCGSLQSMFSSSSEDGELNVLKQELRTIDEGNSRADGRNKMIWEMIATSDHICEQYVNDMLHDEDQTFPFKDKASDALGAKITAAIALRTFDQSNANHTLFASTHIEQPAQAIRIALAKTITRTRRLAKIQLKARLGGYISEYSVKQALMDVADYHDSCSARFAAIELARVNTMQMTAEKRNASIQALIELRQKLMSEGMNTRAVQQKMDALILDY